MGVCSTTHLMSESTSPVDSSGTMEITVAAAATILAAYAAFHYVTANILGPSTPDLNLSLVSHSVYKW